MEINSLVKRSLMIIIDSFGKLMFRFLNLRRYKLEIESLAGYLPSRILIIRVDNIGDGIMSIPVYAKLREKYPHAYIAAMVGSRTECVIKNNPYIDEIIIHDVPWFNRHFSVFKKSGYLFKYFRLIKKLRREKFDLAIDLRGDFRNILLFLYLGKAKYRISYNRTGGEYLLTHKFIYDRHKHEIDKNLNLLTCFGVKATENKVEIFSNKTDREFVERFLFKHNINSEDLLIGIHIKAKKNHSWPTQKYIQLICEIKKKYDVKICLTGRNESLALGEQIRSQLAYEIISSAGQITFLQLFELIKRFNLFISCDTSVAHLMPVVNTPSIVLYGPTSPDTFGYNSERIINIRGSNCHSEALHNKCQKSRDKWSECMKSITVQRVMIAVEKLLNNTTKK